jgi:hypothetical protein
MSNQTLSEAEENEAKELYKNFWKENPNIPNPTDMNSEIKHNFCKKLTYRELSLMQRARKAGSTTYPFTKEEYFKNNS